MDDSIGLVGYEGVVAATNQGRLGELYVRHAPEALRLAYFLTGDREEAQDLVQDAFVKLFGRWQDLRNPQSFDAYLRRTVVNLSKNRSRRARLERRHLQREAGLRRHEEVGMPDMEAGESLWRRLQSLPARQRAAVVLRFCEDLSEAQTAEAMGTSEGAIKALVMRAMRVLRDDMASDDDA